MAEDVNIVDIASSGVVKDTPAVSLSHNIFTDVRNVRFKDGAIRKIEGEVLLNNITSDLSSPLSFGQVRYFATWENPNRQPTNCYYVWVVDLLSSGAVVGQKVYIQDQTGTKKDITPTGLNSGNGFSFTKTGWQHTLFTGGFVFIINNGIEKPHYILDTPGNTNINNITLQELPGWDSYNSAEVKVDKQWFTDQGNYFDLGMKVNFATHTIEVTGQFDKVASVSSNHAGQNSPNASNYVPPTKNTNLVPTTGGAGPHEFFIFTDTNTDTTTLYINGLSYGEQVVVKLVSRNAITVRCGIIKSFGNLLVAGDLTEFDGATVTRRLAGVVRTSDVAAPGSVPGNWNPFSAGVNTADEFVLSETNIIKEMQQLQGNMYIYTNHSIHAMTLTGNELAPISFATVTDQYGCLTLGSVLEYDGKHLVVSDSDIYLFSGNPGTIQSISDAKIRSYFIDNLSPTHKANLFLLANHRENEMWVCYPTLDSVRGECNEALIYNYRDNTWTIRDLDRVFGGDPGPIRGGGVPVGKLYLSGNSGNFGYKNRGRQQVQTLTLEDANGNPAGWPKRQVDANGDGAKEQKFFNIKQGGGAYNWSDFSVDTRQVFDFNFTSIDVGPNFIYHEAKFNLAIPFYVHPVGNVTTTPTTNGADGNPALFRYDKNNFYDDDFADHSDTGGFFIKLKTGVYQGQNYSAITAHDLFSSTHNQGDYISRQEVVSAIVDYINNLGSAHNLGDFTASIITDYDIASGPNAGTNLGFKLVSDVPGDREFTAPSGIDCSAYWVFVPNYWENGSVQGDITLEMNNFQTNSVTGNGVFGISAADSPAISLRLSSPQSYGTDTWGIVTAPLTGGTDLAAVKANIISRLHSEFGTNTQNGWQKTTNGIIGFRGSRNTGNTWHHDGKIFYKTLFIRQYAGGASDPVRLLSEMSGGGDTSNGATGWLSGSGAGYHDITVEFCTCLYDQNGVVTGFLPVDKFGGSVGGLTSTNTAGVNNNQKPIHITLRRNVFDDSSQYFPYYYGRKFITLDNYPGHPFTNGQSNYQYTKEAIRDLIHAEITSDSWITSLGTSNPFTNTSQGIFQFTSDGNITWDYYASLSFSQSFWTNVAGSDNTDPNHNPYLGYNDNSNHQIPDGLVLKNGNYYSYYQVLDEDGNVVSGLQTNTPIFESGPMVYNHCQKGVDAAFNGYAASPETDELIVTPPPGMGSPITLNFDDATYQAASPYNGGYYDGNLVQTSWQAFGPQQSAYIDPEVPLWHHSHIADRIKAAFDAQAGFNDYWTVTVGNSNSTDHIVTFTAVNREPVTGTFYYTVTTKGTARQSYLKRFGNGSTISDADYAIIDGSNLNSVEATSGVTPTYTRGTRVTLKDNSNSVLFDKHYGEGPGRILDPTFTPAANDNHYGSVTHHGSGSTALPNERNSTNDAAYLSLFYNTDTDGTSTTKVNGLSVDLGLHTALLNQTTTLIDLAPTNALKEALTSFTGNAAFVVDADSVVDPSWIQVAPSQFGSESIYIAEYSPQTEVVASRSAPAIADLHSAGEGNDATDVAPTFSTTNTALASTLDIERPWPTTEINPNKLFPIFIQSNTANDGTITNWIRAADVGFDFDGTNYVSYFEREQLSITPAFDTEYVSGVALWAEGGTKPNWESDPLRATLQVRCRATNYPGEDPYLIIAEDNTKTNAKANKLIVNDFVVASNYKVDLKTTGRFINIRIDDAAVDYTATPPNNKAWTISGMQLSVGKKGVR